MNTALHFRLIERSYNALLLTAFWFLVDVRHQILELAEFAMQAIELAV